MSAIHPNFNIWSSSLFANNLILTVLCESIMRVLDYGRSCRVIFNNFKILKILGGPEEGQKPCKNQNRLGQADSIYTHISLFIDLLISLYFEGY